MRISVKLTVPKQVLDQQAVINAIVAKQRSATAPDVEHLFRQTVVGWRTPPTFGHHQTVTRDAIGMEIHSSGPNSDHYALVNAGSPPHAILPKNTGGFLRFQPGYNAGTRPRFIGSRAFSRFGPYVSARAVSHPGFEAREFDQTIADQYEPIFRRDMETAINRAVHP